MARKTTPGMVKVTVRLTFPDGSDAYRTGTVEYTKADRLAFKYARALNEAWLFQLKDNEPDPDLATLKDQVLKEINPGGSGMTWGQQWERKRRGEAETP